MGTACKENNASDMETRRPSQSSGRQSIALWASKDGFFTIDRSPGVHGAIEYCGRVFAELPRIPLRLAVSKPYAALDRLNRNDGHLHDYAERALGVCCALFARHGIKDSVEAQRIVVEKCKPIWRQGHPLLEQIATKCNPWPETAWSPELTARVFSDACFASSCPDSPLFELRYAKVERRWKEEGYQPLPWYFAGFGVLTAAKHLQHRQEKASAEVRDVRGHSPAPKEAAAIRVLTDALERLDPDLVAMVRRHPPGYRIADTHFIIGTLRIPNCARGSKVYLSWQIFTFDFPRALAVFAHEHSHILGDDGSREFTDQLTWLFESALRCRTELDEFEARWLRARAAVRKTCAHAPSCFNGKSSHRRGVLAVRRLPVGAPSDTQCASEASMCTGADRNAFMRGKM